MVTWISTQGYIHPHTDTSTHNYHHIRYNLPLILPLRGGKTYYNNKLVETKESHYIKCNTHEEHQTTPIVGFLPRISLSFGFLIHV